MAATATPMLTTSARAALHHLASDLQRIFGGRLHCVVAYGLHDTADDDETHALALVEGVGFADLTACVPLVPAWRRQGLAVPLVLSHDEFNRSLDVFPLEYGDIIAHHVVVFGTDPFEGITVSTADLRRACELQAKSHLIHLREGFLETDGRAPEIARLIAASAPAFRALLGNIGRLDEGAARASHDDDESLAARAEGQIGIHAAVVREVLAAPRVRDSAIVDPTALFSRYLAATERIWQYVDAWRR